MTLRESILRIVMPLLQPQNVVGKVTAVDAGARTCDVEVDGGYKRLGVRLRATEDGAERGFILYPKVGSYVHISMSDNNRNIWYLAMVSEVTHVECVTDGAAMWKLTDQGEMLINDAQWSVTKAEVLQQVMDTNAQFIDALKQVLATPVNEPGNGAPSVFQQTLNGVLSAMQWGDHSQIHNDKVKHGQ